MAARHPAALLVDDDARLGALVAEYLGQNEIDVTVAADGERGLAALEPGRFDVVLLDVMLPGVDGLEVCRRIRAAPEWSALPILMLTAEGDDVDKIVGLELGADDYLAKPFNPRELLARIRAVLRRARRRRRRGARFAAGGLTVDFDAREVTVERAARRCSPTTSSSCWPRWRARPAACSRASSSWTRSRARSSRRSTARSTSTSPSCAPSSRRTRKEPRYIKTVRGVGYVLSRGSATERGMRLHSRDLPALRSAC